MPRQRARSAPVVIAAHIRLRCRLRYNAAVPLHRGNLFLVGLLGAGKIDARAAARAPARQALRRRRPRARGAARRADPDDLRDRGRGGVPRPRGGDRSPSSSQLADIVLATGGGVVLRAANRERLKENGTVLYLHADPATLWERVRHSRHRPLLQTRRPARAAGRALRAARRAVSRGRRPRRRVRSRAR